ncbi:Insect cuticle protein [Popillia japonica]|uniref:Insect cuticle protein n=1 Tax=Popillia japonica TaxID=7064 RepID=A0AAW1L6M4_POPJA
MISDGSNNKSLFVDNSLTVLNYTKSFKMKTGIVILGLLTFVLAQPQGTRDAPPEPYDFQYKVDNPPTNTFFGQNENGDQQGAKTGSYYVLLPDGRTMTVDYRADAQGFVPKISFQGSAPNQFQG